VLAATPAIRNLIREGKVHQIYSMLQAGGKYGMVTMDMSLAQLVRSGRVSLEDAFDRCSNEDDVRRMMHG
jgi:twitching motility protein PilT